MIQTVRWFYIICGLEIGKLVTLDENAEKIVRNKEDFQENLQIIKAEIILYEKKTKNTTNVIMRNAKK